MFPRKKKRWYLPAAGYVLEQNIKIQPEAPAIAAEEIPKLRISNVLDARPER